MIAKAIIISDGSNHRVVYLKDAVVKDSAGNKSIGSTMTHASLVNPTREDAIAACKDLKNETYADTGSKPTAGTLAVVGVFGAPATLPKAK